MNDPKGSYNSRTSPVPSLQPAAMCRPHRTSLVKSHSGRESRSLYRPWARCLARTWHADTARKQLATHCTPGVRDVSVVAVSCESSRRPGCRAERAPSSRVHAARQRPRRRIGTNRRARGGDVGQAPLRPKSTDERRGAGATPLGRICLPSQRPLLPSSVRNDGRGVDRLEAAMSEHRTENELRPSNGTTARSQIDRANPR